MIGRKMERVKQKQIERDLEKYGIIFIINILA
jgi:hypothetical protein